MEVSPESILIIQERDYSLNQHGSNGEAEKWLDSEYFFK